MNNKSKILRYFLINSAVLTVISSSVVFGMNSNSSYAREEKLDKIVTIDDYNSINKKLSGCTRL